MMQFSERLPSSEWEAITLIDAPERYIWAWFRPAAATEGAFVQIPEEVYFAAAANGPPLTLRTIAGSVGIDPLVVTYSSVYGLSYDGGQGANPVWDHPLTDPGPVADRTIGFFLNPPAIPTFAPSGGQLGSESMAGSWEEFFIQMETDWNAARQLEIQLAATSLQLKGTLGRVASLNRDLTSDEARFSDQRDKHDWLDARRALRDAADRASRFLKDYQTGDTSIAGKRSTYEYLYETYVVSRRPFQGLEQAAREFESHRKSLQTLLGNMSQALSAASQDGERRAQQILVRIAAKVRGSRTKRW